MDTLLIIFAKEPVPGQVKTRLCPPLSHAVAASLYGDFLEDILEEMRQLPHIRLALAHTPAGAEWFFRRLAPKAHLWVQAGADLGERQAGAFAWGFGLGYKVVLVRGTDSPDLPKELVLEAAEALNAKKAEIVLGPSQDGGYYLVGLTQPRPELFRGLAWSTDRVLADTLALVRELQLTAHLLPQWLDIDGYNDLLAFSRKPIMPPHPGWRTHRSIQSHLGMAKGGHFSDWLDQE